MATIRLGQLRLTSIYAPTSSSASTVSRYRLQVAVAYNADHFFYGGLYNDAGTYNWYVAADEDPAWVMVDAGGAPTLNAWYCLEIRRKVGAGTGVAEFWVAGVRVINETGLTRYWKYNCRCCGYV